MSGFSFWHILTIGVGALLTIAPIVTPIIPPPGNIAAAAGIAAIAQIVHLYMPSPGDPASPK